MLANRDEINSGGEPLPSTCNERETKELRTDDFHGEATHLHTTAFEVIREVLDDGSERLILPWSGEAIWAGWPTGQVQECRRDVLTCGPVTLASPEDWAAEFQNSEPLL